MPTSEYHSDNSPSSVRYELLLQKAFDGSLTRDEEREFVSLLEHSAAFAEEYRTLMATKTLIERSASQHSSPDHSAEYWQGLSERVLRRIASESPRRRIHTSFWLQSIATSNIMTPKSTNALKAASLIICGFALGLAVQYIPFSFGRAGIGQTGKGSLHAHSPLLSRNNSAITQAADVREFLQQSHLLLLGMMNLSGECRVTNPESLLLQRKQSFVLLFKARQLKHSLPPNEQELASLLTETEHALAVVAALHPATLDANSVREVQTCSGAALCEIGRRLNHQQPLASLQ
jgi:hypothetical protein